MARATKPEVPFLCIAWHKLEHFVLNNKKPTKNHNFSLEYFDSAAFLYILVKLLCKKPAFSESEKNGPELLKAPHP